MSAINIKEPDEPENGATVPESKENSELENSVEVMEAITKIQTIPKTIFEGDTDKRIMVSQEDIAIPLLFIGKIRSVFLVKDEPVTTYTTGTLIDEVHDKNNTKFYIGFTCGHSFALINKD